VNVVKYFSCLALLPAVVLLLLFRAWMDRCVVEVDVDIPTAPDLGAFTADPGPEVAPLPPPAPEPAPGLFPGQGPLWARSALSGTECAGRIILAFD
jgi:hypothetical protein